MIAFGALDAARRVGVRVPAELSIVGFDDIDMAGWEGFSLTTVRQPLAEMGRAAAKLLLERIALERRARRRAGASSRSASCTATRSQPLPPPERLERHGRAVDTVSRNVVCLRMHCRRCLTSPSSPCLTPRRLSTPRATCTTRSADVHQSFERKGRNSMRRKTSRWVSLAALAVAAAVFVTGALGASGTEGLALREEGRRHHLHEPEPVLRGLGEHGQERPREAGGERDGALLRVRSRGRRAEHEPPDRGQARPDHLGARERIRDRAVLHPREGGGHPDPRRDRPPVGRRARSSSPPRRAPTTPRSAGSRR